MAVTPFDPQWKPPMLHANLTALRCIELTLSTITVYIVKGVLDAFDSCDLDLDPMTFIYQLDPY